MIHVKDVKRTCQACPAQWEGTTYDCKAMSARYRWGFLRVEVTGEVVFGRHIGKESTQADDEVMYAKMHTNGWDAAAITQMRSSTDAMRKLCTERGEPMSFDGHLSYEGLRKATEGVITWPSVEMCLLN